MPLPDVTFPNFPALLAYINANIKPNGNEEIIGQIHNNVENGLLTFIEQSPLNWQKADVVNSAAAYIAQRPVVVFDGTAPVSLTWTDNIYNEYVFVNMTASAIPLLGLLVYYDTQSNPISSIPANSAVNIFKASNDLWVGFTYGGGGGGGSTQKPPLSYVVGVTAGAPTAGTTTWQVSNFANSYVALFVGNILVDMSDAGDGSPYITKTLSSDTLTINNYGTGWNNGDKLSYILITP
jgi:hypothetical protein